MAIPDFEQAGDITLSPMGSAWCFEVHTMSRRYCVRRYVPTSELTTAMDLLLECRWEEFKRRYAELPQYDQT
jgi:hypothetical protein